MATSLTFTSAAFLQATLATASQTTNTKFDILASDATYSRRLYGIGVANTLGSAETVKFHLTSATTSTAYQLYTLNVPASSGNTTTAANVDAFGSVYGGSIFNKQRDANGVPYFNIPANWKLQAEFNTALTSATMSIIVFGETYA
jgi:hypothetical protein